MMKNRLEFAASQKTALGLNQEEWENGYLVGKLCIKHLFAS